jgi:hypothetical protein
MVNLCCKTFYQFCHNCRKVISKLKITLCNTFETHISQRLRQAINYKEFELKATFKKIRKKQQIALRQTVMHFYLSYTINPTRENKTKFFHIKLLKLKRHKLKVIYFIGITFYYFSTAIYFTVFYGGFYFIFFRLCDGKERERENEKRRHTKNST